MGVDGGARATMAHDDRGVPATAPERVRLDHLLSVRAAAEEAPERDALVAGDRVWPYADLAERALAFAARLRGRGLDPSDPDARVALVARADVATVTAVYALLDLRVPIVMVHPRLPAREQAARIEEAAPRLVVDGDAITACPARSPSPTGAPDVLAILHTSGTTGRPKGALLGRAAFVASARASAANLSVHDDDRWLLCMPPAHVGGLSILVRMLIARRCTVLAPASSFDAAAVAHTLAHHRVTLASFVPTMLRRLLALTPPWHTPPSLRAVLLGGAGTAPALLEAAADRGVPVLTTYGLTEACSQVTTQASGTTNRGDLGAGRLLAGVEVRIVDGAIEVRGPTLMSGWFPPGAHPDPFVDGGFLPTLDLGGFDDAGNLHVRGRLRDLIVSGGENVYPAEVEHVLEALPGVREACVFGVDDAEWGERVGAALVFVGAPPEPAPLAALVRERLSPHARPRLFAVVDALVRNGTGKVDRAATAAAAKRGLRVLG